MTAINLNDLGLTAKSAPGGAPAAGACGCGGGGACACGGHGEAHGHGHGHAHGGHHAAAPSTPTQSFEVAGMTCEHCVASVTEELSALDGVESVAVDLKPGTASTVVVGATRALSSAEVRAAVEDAGYTLAH